MKTRWFSAVLAAAFIATLCGTVKAVTILDNPGTAEQSAQVLALWPHLATGHAALLDKDDRVIGSAIIVFPGDVALTAAHVVADVEAGYWLERDGEVTAITSIAAVHPALDSALLCLSQPLAKAARLRAQHLRNGLAIAVGSGTDKDVIISIGSLEHAAEQSRTRRAIAAIRTQPGFSGGPVIAGTGQLLGMTTGYAADQPSTLMVPAAQLHAFLNRHKSSCR